MHKTYGIAIGVLVLLLAGSVAWAQGGQGRQGGNRQGGRGQDGEGRQGRLMDHIVYGEILSISADEIVVKPMIPEQMAEMAQERGRELPELPAEMAVEIGADTKFIIESEMASSSDFKAGDIVVVVKDRDGIARTVSDKDSAKQFVERRMDERGGGGGRGQGFGQGGPGGEGGPGGHGGPGGQGPGGDRRPPAMGSITAISADSITIKPEIPEEMKQRMQENGRELPELPDSITWEISAETRFVGEDGLVDSNPFAVGDKVIVLGPPDAGGAKAIVDAALAHERVRQYLEEFGGGQGGPGGRGGAQGGQGGKRGGKRGGQGGQRNQ
ncbi:hypothetical protein KDL29_12060 [bacterium]|nr:hypothetical protein [bacterium]MCB1221516.1 hypothetical protein [bacterium]UNM09767.1 MAG: hypothetical protein H7A35_06820 [Planctomycetales bacterium]